MKYYIILTLLIINTIVYSQQIKVYDNSNIQVNRYFNNDTINIQVDTAYIMNSNTFKLYNNVYYKFKSNITCKQIYEPTITILENRIDTLNYQYNQLSIQYDNFYLLSEQHTIKNSLVLNSLNNDINILNNNNNKYLKQSITQLIQTHKIKNRKIMIYSTSVGVVFGILVAIIFIK